MTDFAPTAISELPFTEEARAESIQSRVREGRETAFNLLHYIRNGASRIPGWWSPTRDVALRAFWKESDHLAGTLYTMISKMVSIPFRVIPADPSNPEQVALAAERQEALLSGAEFGEGWPVFYPKFIEDLLSTDNGGFGEIIGPGDPVGPLTGAPLTIAHLDSWRCQRTGHPEFPVLYRDIDGHSYKLHYTRVLYTAQMPSPMAEMFGVGFCAISRCLNVAQTLVDILIHKQEKLGSRPYRAIIVTKGGLDPEDVSKAFVLADDTLNSIGLSRYSKIPVIGSQTIPEADLGLIELSKLPDGFDEESSLTLGMATIALAFGVDARELFPSLSSGSTRADALLQHLKQRGKGPGQIIQAVEGLINYKYLPPSLKIKFDFQDDAEDQQAAEIRNMRAKTRQSDLTVKAIDERTARQQMLLDGEITQSQFALMELEAGRLENGMSVLTLFYSKQAPYKTVLDLGVENPEDVQANAPEEMAGKIAQKRMEIHKLIAATSDFPQQLAYLRAEAALDALEELYEEEAEQLQIPAENQAQGLPGDMRDKRVRRDNLAAPKPGQETTTSRNGNRQNKLSAGQDEKVVQKESPLEDLPFRIEASLERLDTLMRQVENGHP